MVEEFRLDHQTTYQTQRLRALGRWLRATPLLDKLYTLLY
jgi:hypothetical protein